MLTLNHKRNNSIPLVKLGQHVPLCDTLDSQNQLITQLWPYPTKEAQKQAPEFCNLYSAIRSKNLSNFLGARITIKSGLNLNEWQHALKDYHDREICAFLRFGWPVGYKARTPPLAVSDNHHSAIAYKDHVDKFKKLN